LYAHSAELLIDRVVNAAASPRLELLDVKARAEVIVGSLCAGGLAHGT
jgi:hypothetical protein